MAISFGKPKEDDVVSLIAARNYARAIEILKQQLRKRGADPSLRMQLADVLILADKRSEAISLLLPLADEYATEGFAAKAVSVLKKIQRIDPRRRDVDARLARLIQEKQREAVLPVLVDGGGGSGPRDTTRVSRSASRRWPPCRLRPSRSPIRTRPCRSTRRSARHPSKREPPSSRSSLSGTQPTPFRRRRRPPPVSRDAAPRLTAAVGRSESSRASTSGASSRSRTTTCSIWEMRRTTASRRSRPRSSRTRLPRRPCRRASSPTS